MDAPYQDIVAQLRFAFPKPVSDRMHDAYFVFSFLRALDQVDALKSAAPMLGAPVTLDYAQCPRAAARVDPAGAPRRRGRAAPRLTRTARRLHDGARAGSTPQVPGSAPVLSWPAGPIDSMMGVNRGRGRLRAIGVTMAVGLAAAGLFVGLRPPRVDPNRVYRVGYAHNPPFQIRR